MAQRQIEKSAGKAAKKPGFANKELAPDRGGISAEMQVELNRLDALIRRGQNGDNAEIARLIRSGAGFAANDKEVRAALHMAAANGHGRICALLIKEYAESGGNVKELITAKEDKHVGMNAMHMAADPKICAMLMDEYAKAGGSIKELIAAKTKNGRTMLHLAAFFGRSTRSCAFLMHEYAKAVGNDIRKIREFISAKDNEGRTALYDAALRGHTEICELLIWEYAKLGGNVKAFLAMTDKGGWTALNWAATRDNKKTSQFLESAELLADTAGNTFMKSFSECVGG